MFGDMFSDLMKRLFLSEEMVQNPSKLLWEAGGKKPKTLHQSQRLLKKMLPNTKVNF